MENVCLVCVSVYGDDNASILSALPKLGQANARAIVSIDPDVVSEAELDQMHAQGVRGVRVNLKTGSERPTADNLCARLRCIASRIRKKSWALELYIGLEQIAMIATELPSLGVPVVIDHMGSPESNTAASQQQGHQQLLKLLSGRHVWVKISGAYRFEELPDLDDYAKALIRHGPYNVLWASDWPHTGGPLQSQNGRDISSFRKVDDVDWIRRCVAWCDNDEAMIHRLFAENPQRLWTQDLGQ